MDLFHKGTRFEILDFQIPNQSRRYRRKKSLPYILLLSFWQSPLMYLPLLILASIGLSTLQGIAH